jgi:hypothetical protein
MHYHFLRLHLLSTGASKILLSISGEPPPLQSTYYIKTSMRIEQTLLQEIEESKNWFNIEKDNSTYKRDLAKRIELINSVLENMKNTEIQICDHIETKMNEIILKINQTYLILEADKLNSELRILNWILYQVCSNEIKRI